MSPSARTAILLVVLLPAFVQGAEPTRFEFEEPHMGTKFRIVFYASDKDTADKAAKSGFARIAELNGIMSDYLATSELMLLCKKFEDKVGEPVKVSADLFYVLEKAAEVSKLSDGSFDVTVRPLVVLWRLARRTQRLPDPKELAEAKALVGYQNIELDPKERTVRLKKPGMQIDLGGIAKGYAADEALKTLAGFQIKSALVAAGGDIAVGDPPPGKESWTVDIAPLPGSKERRFLRLKDAAVSTSGDAEQFVVIDGVRYSHIVDPKTGLGLTGQRSVTVVARRGITSDSMTKMASIFPAEKVVELFNTFDDAAVYIVRKVEKGEEVFQSKRFKEYLVEK